MIRYLAVLLLLPLAAVAQEKKGTQYAFLVGCSGYAEAKLTPLPYTVNDVEQFRQALLETGFEADHIKMLHDKQPLRFASERAKILKEFALLTDGLRPEDTVVVALSGHGVQLKKEGVSYFCPLDADLEDKATLIPLDGKDGLFDQLKACKAKRKLLIVNACRDVRDIPGKRSQAAEKVDLESLSAPVPEGIAAIYSCKAGQKSYFDPKRQAGVFFDHVTKAWKGEYAKGQDHTTIEDFFREVTTRTKNDVDATYGEAQVPEVKREYTEEWRVPVSEVAGEYRAYDTALITGADEAWLLRVGPKRFQEWRRMAARGNVLAAHLAGRCCCVGAGTKKDPEEGAGWYRKAVAAGHAPSMNSLGWCYATGAGVAMDGKEAIALYRQSAALGDATGTYNVGWCYQNSIGVTQDAKEALVWYVKSAGLGDAYAMNQIGWCHSEGYGTPKDAQEAVKWFKKSALLGCKEAKAALARLGNE